MPAPDEMPIPEGGAPAEEVTPAGGPRNLLVLLPKAGVCVALAGAAFAIVIFVVRPMFPPIAADAKKPAVPARKFGKVIALEPVVVNLAQSEGRRYLKATVHLEVPEEEKVVKEVEARKPQLLDLLVNLLSKKTLTEVTAPEGLDALRAEILERMVQAVGKEHVRQVFVTEFVVQ
jgi:flagellar protein FliL